MAAFTQIPRHNCIHVKNNKAPSRSCVARSPARFASVHTSATWNPVSHQNFHRLCFRKASNDCPLKISTSCSRHTAGTRGRARHAVLAQAAVEAYPAQIQQRFNRLAALKQWTEEKFGVKTGLEPKVFRSEKQGFRVGLIASQDLQNGQALMQLPDKAAVTTTDAVEHPLVGPAAESCGGFELSALALWLVAEQAAGDKSDWYRLIQTLPETTDSPILWEESERKELLRGTSICQEASDQAAALENEWQRLYDDVISKDPQRYPAGVFTQAAYLRAFTVVASSATFLPSAQCWALLPLVSQLTRSADFGVGVDYDLDTQLVNVVGGNCRSGSEVKLFDERPNGDLLLATGTVIPSNPNDFVLFKGDLIGADRYWTSKRAILQQLGMDSPQYFPVYKDKMPLQLFAYLRLSRIQDPLLFAKVSFDRDVTLSDINEYEILQLLLGDCREKLFVYSGNSEDDVKLLQDSSLSAKSRLATQLRLGEKEIVVSAMDAIRRRLAPIRGIPVKGGQMEDPNKDILDIFEFIETLPQQPGKFFKNVFGLDEKKR